MKPAMLKEAVAHINMAGFRFNKVTLKEDDPDMVHQKAKKASPKKRKPYGRKPYKIAGRNSNGVMRPATDAEDKPDSVIMV